MGVGFEPPSAWGRFKEVAHNEVAGAVGVARRPLA